MEQPPDDRSLPAPVVERYARQLLVPSMGAEAHAKLAAGSVLVVGAGGLGCGCLPYLAGAGVGTIGIADADVVELSNLHRQPLHDEAGAAARRGKAASAAARLRALNSSVRVATSLSVLEQEV